MLKYYLNKRGDSLPDIFILGTFFSNVPLLSYVKISGGFGFFHLNSNA